MSNSISTATTTAAATTAAWIAGITRVVVHPGLFHADDVCVVCYLRLLGYAGPVVRRVPTQAELSASDVMVADVGGYNQTKLMNFDHHMRGGAGARWEGAGVPYSSFGLVYGQIHPQDPEVDDRFDRCFVQPVDACDCGWGTREGTRPELSFSACCAGFNPGPGATPAERDAAFERAVAWATPVIENAMAEAEAFAAAKATVLAASAENQVLVLDKFVPWDEHLFSRQDQLDLVYVVFPSERGGWMVQQIPETPGSFKGRRPLPEAWAGLRDQALRDSTGVADATFVHPGRFCGGAESKEGTMKMALLAIGS